MLFRELDHLQTFPLKWRRIVAHVELKCLRPRIDHGSVRSWGAHHRRQNCQGTLLWRRNLVGHQKPVIEDVHARLHLRYVGILCVGPYTYR